MQIIGSIGLSGSVCVRAENSFGVIGISESRHMQCNTCRYQKTSCKHINVIEAALKLPSDQMPECLEPIVNMIEFATSSKYTVRNTEDQYNCVSYKPISFQVTAELSEVLKEPYAKRFNVQDGIANLIPRCVCSDCGQFLDVRSTPKLQRQTQIVLPNTLIDANGEFVLFIAADQLTYRIVLVFSSASAWYICNVGSCDILYIS